MKIGNFEISGKKLAVIIGVVAVVGIIVIGSEVKEKQELNELIASEQERLEQEALLQQQQNMQNTEVVEEPSYDDLLQQSLVEQFGQPPEGFIWDVTGNLVAIGTDELSAEQILYSYLRALSILDFSTAQRYSSLSTVVAAYQNYYDVTSIAITDYYDNFVRKQLKESITSIEMLGVKDVAVFADGTQYITIKVATLDLSNKDFWLDDKERIFEEMRVYADTEDDNTKMEQYVYDYILSKYQDGTVGKRESLIEIVVSKEVNGGWLISNDKELCALLEYENGMDVAQYIINRFYEYDMEQDIEDSLQSVGGEE